MEGYAPLVRAADEGLIECEKLLIDNGANVNAGDRSKYTALKYAQKQSKSSVIVEMLVAAGVVE